MKAPALETLAVHGGRPLPAIEGAVATPIFQTSTYLSGAARDPSYDAVRYSRLSNGPSHLVLHRRLALLCEAEAAIVSA